MAHADLLWYYSPELVKGPGQKGSEMKDLYGDFKTRKAVAGVQGAVNQQKKVKEASFIKDIQLLLWKTL